MTVKFLTDVQLEIHTCPTCGVVFGVAEVVLQQKRAQGGTFYCPNAHPLGWQDNELARTKKALAVEQTRRAQAEAQVQDERQRAVRLAEANSLAKESLRRSLAAQKGVTTRIKNRVANGVCPCCNRHFTNLERHMKGQHPDFKGEVPA